MKLYLSGHGYRYACEQSLLVLFPEERPEYPEKRERENAAYLSLCQSRVWTTATAVLYRGGRYAAACRVKVPPEADGLTRDRLRQRALRLAFYRAARASGVEALPWGALTGVRPAKLAQRILEEGGTPARAARDMTRLYYVSPLRAGLCADAASASLAARSSLEPRDVCLYVGIPFCPTRCAYCSFVSSSIEKEGWRIPAYLEALDREIDAVAAQVRLLGLRPRALYMGGGTPTTLSAAQLSALMAHLAAAFPLGELAEYTVEAGRPDTVTPEKLRALRDGGCHRVSINPQTMDDAVLEAIGRRHTAEDVRRAYAQARAAGFDNINMDLIAGLPGDTPAGFRRTLTEVLSMEPENVTVHTLSLKKGTALTLTRAPIPEGAAVREMLDGSISLLRSSGYAPYYLYRQKYISGGFENTGWTAPGRESLYNICVMEELCSVLAMGGGGSTKLVNPRTGYIRRITDKKYPGEYIACVEEAVAARAGIRDFYETEHIPL